MKVSVDLDCTPEELRRLMGLPDLAPVHQAYVERMQKAVSEGLSGETMVELVRSFGPMSDAGMKLWRGLFERSPSSSDGGNAPR